MNERLKLIRKKLGLSREQLADELRISKSAVDSYECGRLKIPDRITRDICKTYNINESWFTTGDGEPFTLSSKEQEIAQIALDIAKNDKDKASLLIKIVHGLTKEEIEVLYDLSEKWIRMYEESHLED